MYYEQNMSQDQIARSLITSRSNISRILSVAKKRGIVEIKINGSTQRETDIEEMLISRFGLRAALVAKVPRSTSDYKAAGQLAVQSFLNHLKPGVKVAVSWGRSIQAMVDTLENDSRPDLTFIPMMGGMTSVPSCYSGETLIRVLAEKFNAGYQILHSPTIVQSPEIKLALMKEPSVAAVIDSARDADVAFVGIGSRGANSSIHILQSAGINNEDNPEFFSKWVGDIAGRFFDREGKPVSTQLDTKTVGLELTEIAKMKRVVGVAAGDEKTDGILAALRGGLISELVTSFSCAFKLLELAEREKLGDWSSSRAASQPQPRWAPSAAIRASQCPGSLQ
jgi:DNA-binding transcriptional regulator LsrR (DeoR family)